jgi:prepilin-type N-terminal cleavage/methylation domain-containing protein
MTTSTFRTKARTGRSLRRGFTLVETMIATGISSIVLSGMMSSFVLLGKNSFNAANYSVMESESRRALESFAQDARMADNITWNSGSSVTLFLPSPSGNTVVTYTYDASTTGPTARTFYRKIGAASSTNPPVVLVRHVSDFAFRRYKVVNGTDFVAANNLETKQLQITLRTVRSGATTVDATNSVLSARVVLRNKQVST